MVTLLYTWHVHTVTRRYVIYRDSSSLTLSLSPLSLSLLSLSLSQCIKALIFNKKCNVNAQNNQLDTPLHLAARWNYG